MIVLALLSVGTNRAFALYLAMFFCFATNVSADAKWEWTRHPSASPTILGPPSKAPVSLSSSPSRVPSNTPTATPSNEPTSSPSSSLSRQPSSAPSYNPTQRRPSIHLIEVNFYDFMMEMTLPHDDINALLLLNTDAIKTGLQTFLEATLSVNTNWMLDSVDVEVEWIVGRRTEAEVSSSVSTVTGMVSGNALFEASAEAPSTAELSVEMEKAFDNTEYLLNSLQTEDELLSSVERVDLRFMNQEQVHYSKAWDGWSNNSAKDKAIILGAAVGGLLGLLLILCTCAFASHSRNKRRKDVNNREISHHFNATQQNVKPHPTTQDIDDDISFAGLSVEDSLYDPSMGDLCPAEHSTRLDLVLQLSDDTEDYDYDEFGPPVTPWM
uniref:Uncharacterized protein n=1 Tax=Attheya septentrionalis TaxID=420275 RepID=A0A7S2XP41_9STRA|mmetsp:Transcript_25003/g.45278  ORF Transcript_25003/g.45278 Transcript_25003/m.45278 type:complete len:382 (+) Transcript_25003:327-1472(+)